MGPAPSDGLRLASLPFAGPTQIEEMLVSRYAMEVLTAREDGDEVQMLAWAERGVATHPDHILTRDLLSLALLQNDRWEHARTRY